MSSNTELTYKDYRLVTRMAFGEDREINQNFYASMEQLGSALADINFGIEDEFYTNTYAKDPNLRWDDMDHDLVALETQDDLHFTSNFSFVYRWLKGVSSTPGDTEREKLHTVPGKNITDFAVLY